MGVTFIAPAEQFTSPAVLITKEITEDGTYYAADDNANGYSSVEVSIGGGGGGSSDFSTAEVTFVDTEGEGYPVYAPFVLEADEYIEQGGMLPESATPASSIYPIYFTDTFTDPVRVALYKGSAYISIDGQAASVSGNATILDPITKRIIQITGDCIITIS